MDAVLFRLATGPFLRLFSCEENIEYTGCCSTEHWDLKARVPLWLPSCPDYREEWCREHVLHCDRSLKGLAIPTAWVEMLSCKLLSTAAASVIYMTWWKPPKASHARTLWYEEQPNAIARQLDFCYIFFIISKHQRHIYLNRADSTIPRKEHFLFHA